MVNNMLEFLRRDSGKVINVNDMDNLIGKVEIIDIREPYEYRMGSLKTSKNITMGNLLSEPDKYLSHEKIYYIICQSGSRSMMAVRQLRRQGFDVVNVSGGVGAYLGTKRE